MKRFYKAAGVGGADGGFQVELDGRPVRSPAKAPLVFPSQALARGVAEEWEAQGDQIDAHSMPLMQLSSTAVDLIPAKRPDIVQAVSAYAGTDLLCYRAEHPQPLVERQAKAWQPLLDWAALQYDAPLHVCTGLMPKPQPEEALASLRRVVEGADDWYLSALQTATGVCGSLVVALALLEGRLSAEEAFEVSQLDETYQIEQWGEDAEATKRRANVRAEIVACRRFVDLLRG
ncbi:ATP12 family chaperone protein [Azospirillum picis]|uniref:Chaperone required for assembly of F1-ATPase n=1 Tax=Azospirillum picis TaxID=488438 RepID=A0ABU0MIX8_9PROT|nr:ATP12 family protein [Azospirillum picis]MBP2299527.1 chaperone required for assembly of F1-ATPase [Azospirillum picis]MDQ0533346.1 chaperone required for assembly of F1-ATPase [Azospirillum picis]